MIQATNEKTILDCVSQFGPAPGAKQMITWEFMHAQEAMERGVYITWVSDSTGSECFRVGSQSRCFCGHLFQEHECVIGKTEKTNCKTCKCAKFSFIPRRPEELGQWHLPRRKGFNINQWRPSCKCKHMHTEHNPTKPFKCKSCSCFSFTSDFCCISCDRTYEEHFTLFETEQERKSAKKAIREAFLPLANNPEIQAATFKKLKLDGKTDEERMMEDLKLGENEEEKSDMMVLNIQEDGAGGVASRPQVQLMIQGRQNLAPKQNLAKPEKSIQLMQQKGLGGQKKVTTVAKGGGFIKAQPKQDKKL